jgi:hypothetical protein
MDVAKLINTLIRLFGRKLMNTALNKGIDYAARRGKPAAEMTEAERAQAQSGKQFASRAKQIRNATRRLF